MDATLTPGFLRSLYTTYERCVRRERAMALVASIPGPVRQRALEKSPLLPWERFEAIMVDAADDPDQWRARIECLERIVSRWGEMLPQPPSVEESESS